MGSLQGWALPHPPRASLIPHPPSPPCNLGGPHGQLLLGHLEAREVMECMGCVGLVPRGGSGEKELPAGVGHRRCFRVSSSVFLETGLTYLRSGLSY